MGVYTWSMWIEHLHDPLVLAGFIAMVLASIVTALLKTKVLHLTRQESERVLKLLVSCFFVMGLTVIVFSFGSQFLKCYMRATPEKAVIKQKTGGDRSPNIFMGKTTGKGTIDQSTVGKQSPNIIIDDHKIGGE